MSRIAYIEFPAPDTCGNCESGLNGCPMHHRGHCYAPSPSLDAYDFWVSKGFPKDCPLKFKETENE